LGWGIAGDVRVCFELLECALRGKRLTSPVPFRKKCVWRKAMKRLRYLVCLVVLLLVAGGMQAQDILVPAGTLLQCTMDEPNFSSATASVGDPVLCHLRSFQEFGRTVFPRGSLLAGHLEAEKDPGHFVGKGYLKITFDRVIIPTGDVPLPAKVIQAKGYKVDKQGDIKGNGHATRDTVEWLIPPLWPWKVLTLPARGPRPTLKGEEPLELRLMDDIVVPQAVARYAPNRPPYASSTRPSAYQPVQGQTPTAVQQLTTQQTVEQKPASAPAMKLATTADTTKPAAQTAQGTPQGAQQARVTFLVLKSNQIYEVSKYQVDGGSLKYRELNGAEGTVATEQVDWRKTTELTAEARSVDVPMMASQTN
jgi:hypothetical protein